MAHPAASESLRPNPTRPAVAGHTSALSWQRMPLWAAVAIIFAVTFLAYGPALTAGFVWDDQAHVTAPHLRSWTGLQRIWKEPGATQQYYPLLHTTFWLEQTLWGGAPAGYHAANIALHATAACLAGLLLLRLAIPGSFLAALIFALHPVHVESVAWISEQKNTLSLVFYLGSALTYLRFDALRRSVWYFLALALFVLGLLTKTVTATLPAALLVIFWWQRGQLSWRRDAVPLLPWFLIAAGAGLFTAQLERSLIGAEGAAFDLTVLERSLLAPRVVWFYLGKLAWPANLTFIYPRWTTTPAAMWPWLALAGGLLLVTPLWRLRTRSRAPVAAFLLFAGSLFPVLGFLNVYPFLYSFVADHFQYLASLSVIALASAGLMRLGKSGAWLGCVAVIALATLTWHQTGTYRDSQTLFRTTIARNPACWMAHNNLGQELLASKATQSEAIACFERALALRPAYFEARNNLGLALTQAGRSREGIPHLEAALRLKPQAHEAHNNLGIALASSGRVEEALRAFAQAAALNPRVPNIQENWAKALVLLGRREEADRHFALAARLRQESAGNAR